MFFNFSRTFFLLLIFLAAVICANAQFPSDNAPDKEDFPKTVKEKLAKGRIDREKKDYQQLIERSEEAVKLSSRIG